MPTSLYLGEGSSYIYLTENFLFYGQRFRRLYVRMLYDIRIVCIYMYISPYVYRIVGKFGRENVGEFTLFKHLVENIW